MVSNNQENVGQPYPLAKHLLAILDTDVPYAPLHDELKRYTKWTLEAQAQLEETHGESKALPIRRPSEEWSEQDKSFMRIFMRREILSLIFEEMEFEEELAKECIDLTTLPTCAKTIVVILEQLETLPCLEEESAPVGTWCLKLSPPMQSLVMEMRRHATCARKEKNDHFRQLYDMRCTLLGAILEKWLAEIMLEESGITLEGLTLIHFAKWTVLVY